MLRKAKKAWRIYRGKGARGVYRRVLEKLRYRRDNRLYQIWVRDCDTLSEADGRKIQADIEQFPQKPVISVLMPVYNVDEVWLRRAVESVRNQLYPFWEFCIADDRSPKPHIRKVLEEYAALDERIKVVFRPENGHISAASNSALEIATGEFCALLDHDDELTRDALYMVAREINEHPRTEMIYSDEDMIDTRGRRFSPKFKPDWSPDLFYSLNLITHLSAYRTDVLRQIGGFRVGMEGSQDYDLALRVVEKIPAENIRHIPRILYHWRVVEGSVALSSDEKPYAHERARRAIEEHFQRKGISAKCIRGEGELHRTIYALPEPTPLVSLITVAEGSVSKSIMSILSKTDYARFELLVMTSKEIEPTFHDERVKIISSAEKSLYALLNEGARRAGGQVLCFIDGSTVVKTRDWLRETVSHALQNEIGAVGAKILYPNNRIKHAGLVMGIKNAVGRAHYKFHRDDLGNFMRLAVAQNFSALSIDCLTVRRDVFESAGGFDAENFPDRYADVDFCLRLLEKGLRNVWTPWAELVQTGSPAAPESAELDYLRKKWKVFFEKDPYYNPNLSKESEDFALRFPCPANGKI